MTCLACQKRGQTWNGSAPRCAFGEDGEDRKFSDNWNCATVNAIRDLVYEGNKPRDGIHYQYCDDMKYATVCIDNVEMPKWSAMTLWVAWYKSRGSTDAMWILDSGAVPRRPTGADLLAILSHYGVSL